MSFPSREHTTTEMTDIVIALMGETGSGKSTFINTVSGSQKMAVGKELHSCTKHIMDTRFTIDGHNVRLVDTPGFSDTELSDTEILKRIAEWLQLSYESGIKLHGIVYLHKLTNDKMIGSAKRNLQMFRLLVGRKGLHNVILASTKASEVSTRAEANYRHSQLETVYWKDMIENGSSVRNYDGQLSSAEQIIRDILRNHPETLQIQWELVKKGKALEDTAAGSLINAEAAEVRRKAEEEKRELERQYEEEQRQMLAERKREKQHAESEKRELQAEHEVARQKDQKLYADLLQKQMAKVQEASEARERQWQIEQEEIREQNREELRQLEEAQRAAEEKSRKDQEDLRRYREEVAQSRENMNNFPRPDNTDPADAFFAWASGFVVASTFFLL